MYDNSHEAEDSLRQDEVNADVDRAREDEMARDEGDNGEEIAYSDCCYAPMTSATPDGSVICKKCNKECSEKEMANVEKEIKPAKKLPLEKLKELLEEISGYWNGEDDSYVDGNGEVCTEEDAQMANEALEKLEELKVLLEEIGITY